MSASGFGALHGLEAFEGRMARISWLCRTLALTLGFSATFITSAIAEIVRAADAAPVTIDALAEDALVATLGLGESLSLHGLNITAQTPARAVIALSSAYLTVAVTSGRISADGGPNAGPGEALVLSLDTGAISKHAYDVERLAASASPGAASLLSVDLEAAAARQRRLRWWGLLEPTEINVAAPASGAIEHLRRSYLDHALIIEQRRIPSEDRAGLTAARFIEALTGGDAQAMAGLIDPAPFLARVGPDGLAVARAQAAASLADNTDLRAALGAAPQTTLADDRASASILGSEGAWRLALVQRDGVIFVAALTPEVQ
jgi:hypothetical protein